MKSFRYEFILNKKIISGKIKADCYDYALEKVKSKYRNQKLKCLRIIKQDNPLAKFFGIAIFDLRTILTKLLPIAIGLLILYFFIYKFS